MIEEVFANNGHILFFKKTQAVEKSKEGNTKSNEASNEKNTIALFVPINQPYSFTPQQTKLLKILNMTPQSKYFKLTLRLDNNPDSISIKPRTLVSTLKYLASMIEGVPQDASIQAMQPLLAKNFMTIKTSKDEPKEQHTQIKHNGLWYYIDNTDTQSKITFESLELMFDITRIIPKNNSTVLISN